MSFLAWIITALGLALAMEGIIYSLAPNSVEKTLSELLRQGSEAIRSFGITALIAGLGLILLGQLFA